MNTVTANQALTLYMWFPLAALIMFMLLIGRFYQQFSGERTFYRLFLLPLVLYGLATVRYASINQVAGDIPGDLLQAAGGAVLLALSLRLGWAMLAGRGKL